ncbi:MAG: phosphopantetheine-binding protein [Gammaproteobacteria bacterium]|nr:phosphopantetheine-binding protein [Gammaproteobacteria bacterium]
MQTELMQKVIAALKKTLNISDSKSMLPETKLRDDLGLDSMTSLTFLMTLEEMFDGFFVDPETLDMRDLDSIQSITIYLEKQLGSVTYAK